MGRFALSFVAAASFGFSGMIAAQTPVPMNLCEELPKAEVKALLGATDAFDRVEPTSSRFKNKLVCSYADFSVVLHDGITWTPPANAEPIQGVGKAAFLVSSPTGVELYASLEIKQTLLPYRYLMISRGLEAGGTTDAAKSGVIAVAKALAAKVR